MKKNLIVWLFILIVLLDARLILIGKQQSELSKQNSKEYNSDNNKSVEQNGKPKSISSDTSMDIIMWYECDHGSLINQEPDNGWWPLNPGYPDDVDLASGGVLKNNYYYLKRASDGAILDSARPPESDSFSRLYWYVYNYIGTEVYIEIVDNNSESVYSWIAADNFIMGKDTLDFESGTFTEWQVISGTAFGTNPNSVVHGSMSGQVGNYWADSWIGGESAVGVLRSKTFKITASTISFLRAGWDGPGLGTNQYRTTTSLLGTYESQDPKIIKQHAYWIKALGCNVIACDLTNSYASTYGYYTNVNKAYELQLKNSEEITEFNAPKIYPNIRCYGTNYSNLKEELNDMYALYQKYPDKWYKLDDGTASKDKPFIVIFTDQTLLNTWAQSGIPAQIQDDRFNVRWTNGFLFNESSIIKRNSNNNNKIPGSLPYWLFVENSQVSSSKGYYDPVYKEMPDGQGVEQMITWASVFLSGNNWDGLRDTVDGKTPIVRYTQPVYKLKPKVLLVSRFSYTVCWPAVPMEGLTRNKSTHIEPNVDWGFLEFNDVADELYNVRGYDKTVPSKPEAESFNGLNNILKIKLDDFPLEYRISNNDSLSGAKWTFLNFGQGGIKLDSAIDRNKKIYMQTRNSFGESIIADINIISNVFKSDSNVPVKFALSQNYPNPFNPTTNIQFNIAKSENVKLVVFNILGQKIATLVNGEMKAGTYTATWNGKDEFGNSVASGIYFYRFESQSFNSTKKMILMK
jgi:hypothetical protein